jgi:hypothetical protein
MIDWTFYGNYLPPTAPASLHIDVPTLNRLLNSAPEVVTLPIARA